MPLLSSNGDEFACNDEVKVYIDEGDDEEPKKTSDNLKEDKLNLVIEVEDHENQSFQEEKEKCELFKFPYYGHLAMAAAAAYAQQNRSSSPKNSSSSFLTQSSTEINNLQNPTKISTYYPGLLQSPMAAAAAATLFHSNNNPLASLIGSNVNPFASFAPNFLSTPTPSSSSSSSTAVSNIQHLDQLTNNNSSDLDVSTKHQQDNNSLKDVGFRGKPPNLLHSELIKAANLYNLAKSPRNNDGKLNANEFVPSNDNWPMQLFNSSNARSSSSNASTTSGSNRPFSPNNMLSQVAAAASAQFLSSLAAAAVACSDTTNSQVNHNCPPKLSTSSCGPNNLLSFYPYSLSSSSASQMNGTLNDNTPQNLSQTHSSSGIYPVNISNRLDSAYTSQFTPVRNGLMRSRNLHGNSLGQLHSPTSYIPEHLNNEIVTGKNNSNSKSSSRSFLSPFDTNNNKHGNNISSMKANNGERRKIDCDERNRSSKPHIKKPLNAFMLYMKEMRPKVQDECTLKESAAINQILGKKWHELPKDQQAKYYEMARKEKELHAQMFPGWSARDNYAMHSKRKKRRKMMIEHKSMNLQNSGNYRSNSISYPGTSQHYSMNNRLDLNSTKEFPTKFNQPDVSFYKEHLNNQQLGGEADMNLTDSSSVNHGKGKTISKTFGNIGQLSMEYQPSPVTSTNRQENGRFSAFVNEISSCNNSDGMEVNSNSQSNSPLSSRENNSFSPGLTNSDISHPKKCRARFGLDQQEKWCKPCRRKKKCIRYYLNGFENEELSSRSGDFAQTYCNSAEEALPTLGGTSLISSGSQQTNNCAEYLRKRKFESIISEFSDNNESIANEELSNIVNETELNRITDNSLTLLNDLRMNLKLFKSRDTASGLNQTFSGKTNRGNDVNWSNLKFSTENFFTMQFDSQNSSLDRNSTPIQGQLKP